MRKLSTSVFQTKAEAIITPSELNKVLQPTHFIPQHKKAAKVQALVQLSDSKPLKSKHQVCCIYLVGVLSSLSFWGVNIHKKKIEQMKGNVSNQGQACFNYCIQFEKGHVILGYQIVARTFSSVSGMDEAGMRTGGRYLKRKASLQHHDTAHTIAG